MAAVSNCLCLSGIRTTTSHRWEPNTNSSWRQECMTQQRQQWGRPSHGRKLQDTAMPKANTGSGWNRGDAGEFATFFLNPKQQTPLAYPCSTWGGDDQYLGGWAEAAHMHQVSSRPSWCVPLHRHWRDQERRGKSQNSSVCKRVHISWEFPLPHHLIHSRYWKPYYNVVPLW